jgi:hypothetical protein
VNGRFVILAAAVAGIAATFLPWDAFDRHSVDGTASHGWISFGAFVVAAACAMYRPSWWIRGVLIVTAGVAVAAAMIKIRQQGLFVDLYASSPDVELRKLTIQIRPGHGVHLVIGASLLLVLGALMWRPRRPGEQPPPQLPRATILR